MNTIDLVVVTQQPSDTRIMDTIFLGNDDQKNLVGSKLTKFCSLCKTGISDSSIRVGILS